MIIYKNKSTNPYFNLASEQYLLDTQEQSIFMLWRNENSVIIGKNQNAYAELDLSYVENNKINVVRRLTGGGAVFHDIGNINFSFIVPSNENATLDFARFTTPIINALTSLGIENVHLSGRNDILIGDTKISGNAQSQYNGKTLHHGTLLYSANLDKLAGALRVDEEKIKAKGIKSVRNRVCNITDFLKDSMSPEAFMDYIEEYVKNETCSTYACFSEEDIKNIQKLADEKYSTWEWNFGKSKEFSAQKKKRYDFGTVNISLCTQNGFIKSIKIFGDFFGSTDIEKLENMFLDKKLEKIEIKNMLANTNINQYIMGMTANMLVELMLS